MVIVVNFFTLLCKCFITEKENIGSKNLYTAPTFQISKVNIATQVTETRAS